MAQEQKKPAVEAKSTAAKRDEKKPVAKQTDSKQAAAKKEPEKTSGKTGSKAGDKPTSQTDKLTEKLADTLASAAPKDKPQGDEAKKTGPEFEPQRRAAAPARERIAANDDLPSIGGLIYALQQRPSRTPFYVAFGASIAWVFLCLGAALFLFNERLSGLSTGGDMLRDPAALTLGATLFVPVALFWFLALLIWRAQELRLMASAMTEVAVRLAEPDKMAAQSVASLGQTIRRQVAAMNDAISRALGRAGELEALVHNEVAALERSYSENELRIRGLIDELASERDALSNNSERVMETLRGVGTQVSKDVAEAGDQATKSLASATSTLANSLSARGSKITEAISAAGTAVDNKLAERGSVLTQQLSNQGESVTKMLDNAGTNVSAALHAATKKVTDVVDVKSNQLVNSLSAIGNQLVQDIPGLLDRLDGEQKRLSNIISGASKNFTALEAALAERTTQLDGTLKNRTEELKATLADRIKALDSTVQQQTRSLESMVTNQAKAIEGTVGKLQSAAQEQTALIDATVTNQSKAIAGTVGKLQSAVQEQAASIDATVINQSKAIAGTVGKLQSSVQNQAASIDAMVTNQTKAIEGTVGKLQSAVQNQAKAIEDTVQSQARAIESSVSQQARSIESSVSEQAASLASSMNEQAKAIEGTIQGQAKAIESTMTKNSMTISQVFAEGTDAIRKTTEYMSQQSEQSNTNMTAQMEGLRGVSGKLLNQVHSLTERFETQGQAIMSASQALDSSNAQIDSILERRHAEIASLLDTVSTKAQALDQMMRSYSGIIEGSLVQVEERAKQITASLAHETTAQADSTIKEIERLRSSARQHTEQAVAELTGGFQSITSEVADQLGTLTSRFGETTREIRQTASSTAGEIEETRQELTRRMQGLPEATLQSQEAVRKAVSDQLKALGTLSALSTGAGSAAPPASPPAQTTQPALPPAAGYGSTPSSGPAESSEDISSVTADLASQLGSAATTPPQPPAQQTPPEAARGATSGLGVTMRPPPSAAQDDRWSVGDLLARASGPDIATPPTPPQSGAAPYDAPAAAGIELRLNDIASAIDQNTASAVWQRFRRGERDIFNRQLYTSQGQATFDEIATRYQRDATFRATVDRYIGDFERLLSDAERKGQNGQAIDNYLVSETGRVYLMLAHASGRLQ